MRSAILLVCAIAFPRAATAGPCAIQTFAPSPLVSAAVAPGGGVIVALQRAGFGGKDATSAVDKAWRFKDVNVLVVPGTQEIAPGLAVYMLPPTGGPELQLLDGDGNEVAKVMRASKPMPALDAPTLRGIVYETKSQSMGRRGAQTYTSGTADLDAIPDTAAALIVYEVTKTGNVARSWTTVHMRVVDEKNSKATKLLAYQSGGRCNPSIPGMRPISDGEKVVVAWLDNAGRLSPVSKPVTARALKR